MDIITELKKLLMSDETTSALPFLINFCLVDVNASTIKIFHQGTGLDQVLRYEIVDGKLVINQIDWAALIAHFDPEPETGFIQ